MSNEKKMCEFEGCGRKRHARGLCQGHSLQQKQGKKLSALQARRSASTPLQERLAENIQVDPDSGCHIWKPTETSENYGSFRQGNKTILVHRAAWELENGPIPAGMIIDHLCHNRACANVEHLRLVSRTENNTNQQGVRAASGYRGVYQSGSRWQAMTQYKYKRFCIGTYDTPEQAAQAVKDFWESRGIIYNSTEQDSWREEVRA